MNQWHRLRDYINSLPKLQIFNRKEMIEVVHGVYPLPQYTARNELTIDHYRRFLTVLNYISHVGNGMYMKVETIPMNLTRKRLEREYSQQLRREANERSRNYNRI